MTDESEILRRLLAVEDRLALIELEGAYARSFDARDGDVWSALFTDDGIYQARGATPKGGGTFVQGRSALATFCTDAPFTGIHFMHLPQITLSRDSASSRIHLEFIGAFEGDGSPVTRMLGHYDVSYVRGPVGWLIKHRTTSTFARSTTAAFGYRD